MVDHPLIKKIYGVDRVNIAVTQAGARGHGPEILMLHGVPTNKSEFYGLMKLMKPFAHLLAFDMLNMGDSTKITRDDDYIEMWKWAYDPVYIRIVAAEVFGQKGVDRRTGLPIPNPFYFVASDWGGGIAMWYASMFPKDLKGLCLLDPIALDGYPVSEIQDFGRAATLPDDIFNFAMGSADSKMTGILKYMTHTKFPWDQYTLRRIKAPYVDTDYERPHTDTRRVAIGVDADGKPMERVIGGATSLTLGLKTDNLRALAERAAVLSPNLLLPYDTDKNPEGLLFGRINMRIQIIWGLDDQMMPEAQRHRLRYLFSAAPSVRTDPIQNADHFVELDQPELVADRILDWIAETPEGRKSLADIFLGFPPTKWEGNEDHVFEKFREMVFGDPPASK